MQGRLNQNKIDYIVHHLRLLFRWDKRLEQHFVFGSKPENASARIIFTLSEHPLGQVKRIGHQVVLFPASDSDDWYIFDQQGNLVFRHDLLKSAFYLLSGYQESLPYKGDAEGRFSFADSIQKKFEFATFPLVNFYFEIVGNGLAEFCRRYDLAFERRDIWDGRKFGFVLSHDVDRVDQYTIHELKLRLKQLLRSGRDSGRFYLLIRSIIGLLRGENPYWNFEWMKKLEKTSGLNSVWYFLPRHVLHRDAYYSFSEQRIKQLAASLLDAGDEIGLHGVYHARNDQNLFQQNLKEITALTGRPPAGVRQHWLSFKYPQTLRIIEKAGLKYDTSWAFADYAGWRNSFCLPFRPYDLEQDRMMNLWEVPLCVMDASLLEYQKLSTQQAFGIVDQMLQATRRFNGLFVLLWHNSFFDEYLNPGVVELYQKILDRTGQLNARHVLPANLIEYLEHHEASV